MADGSFPGLVSKDRNVNATTNPIYVNLSDGTASIGVTGGALDVNIDNASIAVTATDLDIRDLVYTQDSIEIWANTAKDGSGTNYVPLVDSDGKLIISNPGGTQYTEDVAAVTATGPAILAERDDVLGGITPAEGDWSKLYVTAEGALWVQDFNSDAMLTKLTDIETNTDSLAVVGGGTEAAAIRVTIANDSTGLLSVDDNGGSLTVDGTVAVSSVGGTVAVTQSGAWTVAATQSGVWDIGTVTTLTGITNDVSIDDGGNSITVDAIDLDIRDIVHTQDSVALGDGTGVLVDVLNSTIDALQVAISDGADQMAVNTDGSINVNIVTALVSGEVHDYDTAAGVAADATSNHDYTVTGAGTNSTFKLDSVIWSGSGSVKVEIQTGPLASLATVAVGFLQGRQGDTKQLFFDPPIEVPVTSTGTVRVIRTNRQGASTDVYSTIIGQEV